MIRECLVMLMVSGTLTAEAGDRIAAEVHDSGLAISHDSYNAISRASDGRIYYVLSTESLDTGAQMYVYHPAEKKIRHLGDLTEACGEKGLKAIPQGKSHVNFVDAGEKLYFATHVGYYSIEDGMETMGKPPAGYKPYPGGHFLSYDVKTGRYENLALAPNGEGIITMNMDTQRGRLYGITWPTGLFLRYDLKTKSLRNLGGIANQGESVQGPNYQTICRSLTIDPRDGSVYFTNSTGTIFRYRYDRDAIETVTGDNLRKDYFGLYDPASPGHMGYNWRQTVWSEADAAIVGVHGNSGYLFRFDPRAERVEVLDRITSRASKASGMFDQFSYGYLGFTLAADGHTIHYLTGGPIYENGHRVAGKESTAKGEAKGMEDLHLVTYDLKTGTYRDSGSVFLPDGSRPTYVNSIAVGNDGTVYTLARITVDGKTRGDLISFPGPLKTEHRHQ
ncbi:MAG: hypothetical protein ABI693_16330 [Bryobacteraceae bacterium]